MFRKERINEKRFPRRVNPEPEGERGDASDVVTVDTSILCIICGNYFVLVPRVKTCVEFV